MKTSHLIVFFAALGSLNVAFGDDTVILENLKKAQESLGKMGLNIERVGTKVFSGRYGVAVPRSAIIEEEGKSFVVILDAKDPSNSERLEVQLGGNSGDYVHAQKGVAPGDYLVLRRGEVAARTVAAPVQPEVQYPVTELASRATIPVAKPIVEFRSGIEAPPRQQPQVQARESKSATIPQSQDDRFYYVNNSRPSVDPNECKLCNGAGGEAAPASFVPRNTYEPAPTFDRLSEYGFERNYNSDSHRVQNQGFYDDQYAAPARTFASPNRVCAFDEECPFEAQRFHPARHWDD